MDNVKCQRERGGAGFGVSLDWGCGDCELFLLCALWSLNINLSGLWRWASR